MIPRPTRITLHDELRVPCHRIGRGDAQAIEYNGIDGALDRAITGAAQLDPSENRWPAANTRSRWSTCSSSLACDAESGLPSSPRPAPPDRRRFQPRAGSYAGAQETGVSSGKPKEFDPKAACDEVIKAHNRIRAEAKLPPLELSTKLQAAAEQHAKDMAAQGKMTHKGSDGSSSIHRISAKGYKYRRAGENIAAGHFAVEGADEGLDGEPAPQAEHPRQLFPNRRGLRNR